MSRDKLIEEMARGIEQYAGDWDFEDLGKYHEEGFAKAALEVIEEHYDLKEKENDT